MPHLPVAAGKSSIGHIDQDLAFAHIVSHNASSYLDLACGAGNYALALARRAGATSVVHSLDLWAEGIATLKERAHEQGLANIQAQVADITQPLPLADDSIDVGLIATALHDLPAEARGRLLAEVKRVLAPRGAFVIIEFKKLDHGPGPRKEHKLGEEDARALLEPLGFSQDAFADLGEFTYLARFVLP